MKELRSATGLLGTHHRCQGGSVRGRDELRSELQAQLASGFVLEAPCYVRRVVSPSRLLHLDASHPRFNPFHPSNLPLCLPLMSSSYVCSSVSFMFMFTLSWFRILVSVPYFVLQCPAISRILPAEIVLILLKLLMKNNYIWGAS